MGGRHRSMHTCTVCIVCIYKCGVTVPSVCISPVAEQIFLAKKRRKIRARKYKFEKKTLKNKAKVQASAEEENYFSHTVKKILGPWRLNSFIQWLQ
jgi:hypothetical protein